MSDPVDVIIEETDTLVDLTVDFPDPIIESFNVGSESGGSTAWGTIIGTLSTQADLQTALNAKQNSLGFTAENVANKTTDGTLAANSDTFYPSEKAVKTYADTKQASLGYTAENVANKDTDGTLSANSDTKYASQKATKTYVDGKTSSGANPSATVSGSAVNGVLTTFMRSDAAPALANTAVTAASYGAANKSPTYTVDAQGRLTAAADVTITPAAIGSPAGSGTSTGTNTGDQTSIVGITGTLTEFNTALTGADFATGGGVISGTSSGANTGDQDLSGLVPKTTTVNGHALSSNVTVTDGDLGATTVGDAMFKLTNPSAITFPRFNADNSVTALSASAFRTAIGAGTGGGDALTANPLSQFASTTSAQLAGVISDEVGTGALVFQSYVDSFSHVNRSALIYLGL